MRYLQHSSPLAMAILLALSWGCNGGGGEFPDSDASVSEYTAELTVSPVDRHMGEELTLTFAITHHGSPGSGLNPEIEFEGPAMGTIAVVPGTEPGTYVGTHTFDIAGTYSIHMHFMDDEGGEQELMLSLVIAVPDEH